MNIISLYFTLCCLIQIIFGSNIIQVNDKNFKEVVIESGKYSLVDFYADWCRHCQNLMPIYGQLGDLFAAEPNIQILKINGDKDGRKMTKKYNVEGFPTIMFFHGDAEPVEYNGGRDVESLSNFVQQLSGVRLEKAELRRKENEKETKVLKLNDLNFEEKVLNSKLNTAVVFSASWCGYCSELKPIWNQLANEIYANDNSTVQFGTVEIDKEPADKLKEKFNIKSLPTILFFDPEDVDEDGVRRPDLYYDERKLEHLIPNINYQTGLHRNSNGRLLETAGRINGMDKLIEEKLLNANDRNAVGIELLNDMNEIIKISRTSTRDRKEYISKKDDLLMEPYYRKLINKIINGEDEFFINELNRLTKVLRESSKSLQPKTIDSMEKRVNVLRTFIKKKNI